MYNIEDALNVKKNKNNRGMFSLFPLECDVKIPFMYNYALAADYFLKNLIIYKNGIFSGKCIS